MKKLINGILDFRRKCLPDYLDNFSHLANGQSPDALLIACSDSRVAPNVFASTNPGDVFVIRNVGNIIPEHHPSLVHSGCAEAAAIEFSLNNLPIKDIIVCGHSDCNAMRAVLSGLENIEIPSLKGWLSHCGCCANKLKTISATDKQLDSHNQLSQMNVLQQIAHLKTYPIVQERIAKGQLNIHGWYFDIAKGDVYSYEEEFDRFLMIDETEALRILKRLR